MYLKNKLEPFVFFGLLIVHLIYIWTIPIFITQDGPSHLYNSTLLENIIFGVHQEFYSQFLELNHSLTTNWFSSLIYIPLLKLFSPIIAEKVFISLLTTTLSLAGRFCIRQINQKAIFLSSIFIFLSFNFYLYYGFYNFLWSASFLLLFIGFYLKDKRGNINSIRTSVFLLVTSFAAFISHPIGTIEILIFLAFDLLWTFNNGIDRFFTNKVRYLTQWSCLFSLGIIFLFLSDQTSSSGNLDIFENRLSRKYIENIFQPNILNTFSIYESLLYLISNLTIFILLSFAVVKNYLTRSIFVSLFFFNLIIYFFVSDEISGGSYLTGRVLLISFFYLIPYAASFQFSQRQIKISLGIFALICTLNLSLKIPKHYENARIAKCYLELNQFIQSESIILPISFANYGPLPSSPTSPFLPIFKHLSGYLGAETHLVSLDNYEANTSYFPLRWLSEVNPYQHLSSKNETDLEQFPEKIEIDYYHEKTGLRIDYVIVFGNLDLIQEIDNGNLLLNSIHSSYELIFSSECSNIYLFAHKSIPQ